MTAGVYARITNVKKGKGKDKDKDKGGRKPTESELIESNVRLQIDGAREFATRQGWRLEDKYTWSDDARSGEVFDDRRPGFQSMIRYVLDERPKQTHGKLDVLLLFDEDRFGRGADRSYWLRQVTKRGGVRIVCWGGAREHGREVRLGSAMDDFVESASAFRSGAEIEMISKRVTAKLDAKFDKGEVVGRPPYGFDKNMEIIEREAKVVRRIFAMKASDENPGYWVTAARLNADKVPAPRAGKVYKLGRVSRGIWGQSSVRGVLFNRAAVGVQERKGKTRPCPRLIKDDLWKRAHANIKASAGRTLRSKDGRRLVAKAGPSPWLLAPLLMCAKCGGSMFAWQSTSGKRYYRCTNYHQHGRAGCTNTRGLPMELADREVTKAYDEALVYQAFADVFRRRLDAVKDARIDPAPIRQEIRELENKITGWVEAIGDRKTALTSDLEKRAADTKAHIEHLQGQLLAAEVPLAKKFDVPRRGRRSATC